MNLRPNRLLRPTMLFWLALLGATALLSGCSNGPDKDQVREILQQQVDDSGKVIVVSQIDHLNSAKQKGYWLVDVKATLSFKQSAADLAKSMQNAPGSKGLSGMAGSLTQMGLVLKYGDFKAGDTRQISTQLQLIRGDHGWMLRPQD